MDEYLKRNYLKEEEFLDEFYHIATIAATGVNGEWLPNAECNDSTRRNQDYFRSTGELSQLVFVSAAVYHTAGGFSSVQILLESSKRVVNIHVKTVDGELVAQKILDRST